VPAPPVPTPLDVEKPKNRYLLRRKVKLIRAMVFGAIVSYFPVNDSDDSLEIDLPCRNQKHSLESLEFSLFGCEKFPQSFVVQEQIYGKKLFV